MVRIRDHYIEWISYNVDGTRRTFQRDQWDAFIGHQSVVRLHDNVAGRLGRKVSMHERSQARDVRRTKKMHWPFSKPTEPRHRSLTHRKNVLRVNIDGLWTIAEQILNKYPCPGVAGFRIRS